MVSVVVLIKIKVNSLWQSICKGAVKETDRDGSSTYRRRKLGISMTYDRWEEGDGEVEEEEEEKKERE